MIKRTGCLLIAILLLMTFVPVSLLAGVEIEDISSDHWAYEEVVYLIEEGYLTLYEDDTFRGQNLISRYQMAVLMARILQQLDERELPTEEEDLELMRELTTEFRRDLVELAEEARNIQQELDTMEDHKSILHEDISKGMLEIEALKEEIDKNIDDLISVRRQFSDQIEGLESEMETFEKEMDASRQQMMDELEMAQQHLQDELEKSQRMLEERIKRMEDETATLEMAEKALEETREMRERLDELEKLEELREMEELLSALQREQDSSREEIEELKDQQGELVQENENLRSEQDRLLEQVASMQEEVNRFHSSTSEELEGLREENTRMKLIFGGGLLISLFLFAN